jgi:hypothetical protein
MLATFSPSIFNCAMALIDAIANPGPSVPPPTLGTPP